MLTTESVWDGCLESDGTTESEMMTYFSGPVWLHLSHLLSRRRISVFGHVARLDDDTPANMALQLHINLSLNRPPDRTWRSPPGRPRHKWLEQLQNVRLDSSGGVLSTVDTVEQRRDGPRRLHDHDDNDDEFTY